MKEQANPFTDTKKRILEAAGIVFAEFGFQNATVREICKRAGVNIAAINYHFKDKKGLYLAVLKYGKDTAFRKHPLDPGTDKSLHPEERLKAFVAQFIERVWECHHGETPWFRKLMVGELLKPTEGLDMVAEEATKPIFRTLSAIVRELLCGNATEDRVNLCCASIIGQSLIFFYAEPMMMRLFPVNYCINTKLIADHIANFSLNAIQAFASEKRGDTI